jgi:hypothetical protein
MQIIECPINMNDLKQMAAEMFGDMVKAVVDIEKELVAVDAELHSDLEAMLLQEGSKQENLWGINFYPEIPADGFVEFDSLINIRPAQGNRSRGVEDEKIRKRIFAIIDRWIEK